MGRHRSDPMGIARLVLIGLAVLLALAVAGAFATSLLTVLGSGDAEAVPSSSPRVSGGTPSPASTRTATVQIVCSADRCPVFVRIPGGDVLMDRDLTRGEQASYFDPELDVVLGDASTVTVLENGTQRPPGETGERQAFKVSRSR
ncbi:hypothetical protein IMZ11_16300 [Microtetraspora sp. AC03309]|uniref:hypothetical protein n=1 Tax=Microtetraspora sp. AC03309 TaxID=2779376 RepID=UPI001E345586|nr:hypothetical protein [Microtetraspora sp. AC03309]MCC5577189.1 hypothetical protein [Microtetraspora sp. AC03309]